MTKDSVVDALRALATGNKSRSETARLRDIVDEVEAALAAGVSRAAILETLNAQGFTMTLKSFESALYRIRKKRTQPAPAPAPAPENILTVLPVKENKTETAEENKPVFRCLPIPDGISPVKKIPNVPDHVYLPGELEHPAIKGLMLSLDQRFTSIQLEYINESNGEVLIETDKQKRFRFRWKTPVPMTISSTDSSFTEMDMSIFKKH